MAFTLIFVCKPVSYLFYKTGSPILSVPARIRGVGRKRRNDNDYITRRYRYMHHLPHCPSAPHAVDDETIIDIARPLFRAKLIRFHKQK